MFPWEVRLRHTRTRIAPHNLILKIVPTEDAIRDNLHIVNCFLIQMDEDIGTERINNLVDTNKTSFHVVKILLEGSTNSIILILRFTAVRRIHIRKTNLPRKEFRNVFQ